MTDQPSLTPKQARFVAEYAASLNATDAAIKAGYSKNGASTRGAELLAERKIQSHLSLARSRAADLANVKLADVLIELKRVAMANVADFHRIDEETGNAYFDASLVTRDHMAAVGKLKTRRYNEGRGPGAREVLETEISMCDKLKALEMLGRYLGMFGKEGAQAAIDGVTEADYAQMIEKDREREARMAEISSRFKPHAMVPGEKSAPFSSDTGSSDQL